MKRIKKAVATVGKYTDRNGQEKNRYLTVGGMFKRDDGSVCMKLDTVPVGPDFNGWISFYDLDDQQQAQQPAQQAPQPPMGDDESLPF